MLMPWGVKQGENVQWPIPVRRNGFSASGSPTSDHERSTMRGEMEGEMDPELLLNYGLERINLPSGKTIFKCGNKRRMTHGVSDTKHVC